MVKTKQIGVVLVALLLVTAGGVATAATAQDGDDAVGASADYQSEQEDDDDGADGDAANFEVSDLSAVDAAPAGDVVTVTADLTNPADERAEGFVEFRLDGEVVERRHLALEGDESRLVEFNVNTTDVPPGDYVHGVFTADSGEVAEITVVEAAESFTVANLSAPDEATVDDPVTVTAEVSNEGNETDEQAVDARLDGDVVDRTTVSLDAGENETVEFEVTPEETGTQYLSVFTRDDGEFQRINVAAEDDDDDAPDRPDDADDGDDAEPTANITFENQTSDGTTVTVAEVNTSDGGFVAIHDDSLLDGNVVGSVIGVSEYIEPGEEDELEVELFDVPGAEFDEDELTENQTLIAMPHLDSNDNETYDFVATQNGEDGPYIDETGEPVVDDAFVTVEDDGIADNATDNATDEEPVADNATDDGIADNVTEDNATDDGVADNATDDGVADNITEDNATDDDVADNATGDDAADNATDGVADDETDGVADDATDDLPADNATDGPPADDAVTAGNETDNGDDAEGNETAGNESDGADDEALIG